MNGIHGGLNYSTFLYHCNWHCASKAVAGGECTTGYADSRQIFTYQQTMIEARLGDEHHEGNLIPRATLLQQ